MLSPVIGWSILRRRPAAPGLTGQAGAPFGELLDLAGWGLEALRFSNRRVLRSQGTTLSRRKKAAALVVSRVTIFIPFETTGGSGTTDQSLRSVVVSN
jgi:hypothetical protein